MILIALSEDRSYKKDNIRGYIIEVGRVILETSTVHFDEVSRKKIYQAIDNANFSDIKLIKENYLNLKNKLGYILILTDFDKYGEMDVLRIFDNKSIGSYYKILVKYENEYKVRLSDDEVKIIAFASKKLANGKRIHKLELLQRMMIYRNKAIRVLDQFLKDKYNKELDKDGAINVINMMTNEFPLETGKKTYELCISLEKSWR